MITASSHSLYLQFILCVDILSMISVLSQTQAEEIAIHVKITLRIFLIRRNNTQPKQKTLNNSTEAYSKTLKSSMLSQSTTEEDCSLISINQSNENEF